MSECLNSSRKLPGIYSYSINMCVKNGITTSSMWNKVYKTVDIIHYIWPLIYVCNYVCTYYRIHIVYMYIYVHKIYNMYISVYLIWYIYSI